MSVVIRLNKTGTKKKIKHRIIVADSRSPRDGRFIEMLGIWDPNADPAILNVDTKRAQDWIHKGARPTVTVRQLLKKAGVKSLGKK